MKLVKKIKMRIAADNHCCYVLQHIKHNIYTRILKIEIYKRNSDTS
jgi:hypothetical protein